LSSGIKKGLRSCTPKPSALIEGAPLLHPGEIRATGATLPRQEAPAERYTTPADWRRTPITREASVLLLSAGTSGAAGPTSQGYASISTWLRPVDAAMMPRRPPGVADHWRVGQPPAGRCRRALRCCTCPDAEGDRVMLFFGGFPAWSESLASALNAVAQTAAGYGFFHNHLLPSPSPFIVFVRLQAVAQCGRPATQGPVFPSCF